MWGGEGQTFLLCSRSGMGRGLLQPAHLDTPFAALRTKASIERP